MDELDEVINDCAELNDIEQDEMSIFSCIMTENKSDEREFVLTFSCLDDNQSSNPYTLKEVIQNLFVRHVDSQDYTWVRAPLELYHKEYQGMLVSMLNSAYYKYYGNMGLHKENMLSILNESITYLFNHPTKKYYLHKHLIFKTFNNNLKKALRNHVKNQTISLDRIMEDNGDGSVTTALDLIPDPITSAQAYALGHTTQKDHFDEILERVRNAIIDDIGQERYNGLLQRLDAKALTNNDSQLIQRYKREFNPKKGQTIIIAAKPKGGIK